MQSHRDEIYKLYQEIDNVKKDAKIVIDRRKANEAIDLEKEKRRCGIRKMQRKIQERDLDMRKSVNKTLGMVEKQVTTALCEEHFSLYPQCDYSCSESNDNISILTPPKPMSRKLKRSGLNMQHAESKLQLYVNIPTPPDDACYESIQSSILSTEEAVIPQKSFYDMDPFQPHKSTQFDFNECAKYDGRNHLSNTRTNSVISQACSKPYSPPQPIPLPPPIRRISTSRRWEMM